MNISDLRRKIENKEARLAVIGLGYVGLPVAALFAESGFDVLGIEIRQERVEKINAGKCPIEGVEPGLSDLLKKVVTEKKLIATADYLQLNDRDVVLIDVETPVDENNIPQYKALRASLKSLFPVLKQGALVIVESTIAPRTMADIVLPLLEQQGKEKKALNDDFYLGNCPERVMPGKLLQNLRTVSRVVGGMSPETADTMVALYQHIVGADLDPTDCITAELVKTTENAYRDVQIAFANEVALICEAVGGDVWKVRELVNKSPGRQMHLPGAGVGGHCIPKDPWLLAYGTRDSELSLQLIPAARRINNSMPLHMTRMLEVALAQKGKSLKKTRITVLGYAYLEDSDDTRNSPSKLLIDHLQQMGAKVMVHDPFVKEYQGNLLDVARQSDALVAMVKHQAYQKADLKKISAVMSDPVLIDGRRIFSSEDARIAGFSYFSLGISPEQSSGKS
ncbi:MAG: nucleotide sugar dehydrogenase [Anaerolineales bacterium]|nr:nucleotide sugar dehydrogenase [Anaerolineales bacterium]